VGSCSLLNWVGDKTMDVNQSRRHPIQKRRCQRRRFARYCTATGRPKQRSARRRPATTSWPSEQRPSRYRLAPHEVGRLKTLTGFSRQPLPKQGDVADCAHGKSRWCFERADPKTKSANRRRLSPTTRPNCFTTANAGPNKCRAGGLQSRDYTVKDRPAIWLNSSGCSQGFSSGQDMMGFQPQNIFVTI
jgi:hypothetical protein